MTIPVPEGLDYLPFQKDVINWMRQKQSWRSILALEMGTGKTVCCCGIINLANPKHVLIIAPIYMLETWKRELIKWLVNSYTISILKNTPKSKKEFIKNKDLDYQIFLTNYESILKHDLSRTWDILIADECGYIKNTSAKRTKAYHGLKGHLEYLLNGTMVLNKIKELYSPFKKIRPQLFPSEFKFQSIYCDGGYEFVAGRQIWTANGATNIEQLKQIIKDNNMMIRITKEEVLKDLPSKTIQPMFLPITTEHTTWYDQMKTMTAKEKYEFITSGALDTSGDSLFSIRKKIGMEKVPEVISMIEDMLEEKQQIIIFAHHQEVIDALMISLEKYKPVMVTGKNPKDRQNNIDLFVNDKTYRLFIASISAASLGLTLTNTDSLVFVEIPWSWGIFDQCVSRSHRLGQLNPVFARVALIPNSIDEEIWNMILDKKELGEIFNNDGNYEKHVDGSPDNNIS